MASTSTSSSSSALSTLVVDGKAPRQPQPQKSLTALLTSLPPPPALHSPPLSSASAYCRKIARNVAAMATGEVPAEVAAAELPEILKSAKEAWDKVEDKYAVSSLAVAGAVAVWASSGMISAIDRLPLIPGILELVGIGYTGWFAYKNLVFKPDREALFWKIKDIYSEVTGSS
ncbi:protein CURVATURE THYLAKOID 1B, chloroplastic [Rhodamnia argentea]|uniref:Protein CURVATURE THYLAKOID 1B, chloroplastic n=1 Tax=Rhodamnia argentea TaxID=178133 RepID=A0A8B8QLH4_9MYRT|nr:protein CURVATURE THYLAKOID 1B, chloroplastic [Rhodamnia argentea]